MFFFALEFSESWLAGKSRDGLFGLDDWHFSHRDRRSFLELLSLKNFVLDFDYLFLKTINQIFVVICFGFGLFQLFFKLRIVFGESSELLIEFDDLAAKEISFLFQEKEPFISWLDITLPLCRSSSSSRTDLILLSSSAICLT
jgi:hypothetical protein